MKKSFKISAVILLFAMSLVCFLYLNYCTGSGLDSGISASGSELTDVRISKFIFESLKKVALSGF